MFLRFIARRNALDDGRHEESEKIQSEERFNAPLILDKDGSNLVYGLICSKRFSIVGWPLWASSTWAGDIARSLVISGHVPSLLWS